MKTKKTKSLILGLMMIAGPAMAQEHVGNGGGVQYCPNPIQSQINYETYDLREIQNHIISSRKRTVKQYDGHTAKEQYFQRAVEKVRLKSPQLAGAIERAKKFYDENVRSSEATRLEKVQDVDLFSLELNCEYQQLVNWIEPEQMLKKFGTKELMILRNDLIYHQMNPLQQAANDFHEAAYRVRRAFQLEDQSGSNFVRMFTGQAFGEGEIDSDLFPKISLYGQVLVQYGYSSNTTYKTYITSKPCSGVTTVSLTNLGDKSVVDQFRNNFKSVIKPGQTVTSVKNGYFWIDLATRGLFTKKTVPVKIEVSTCGETFVDELLIKSDGTRLDYSVTSSPI